MNRHLFPALALLSVVGLMSLACGSTSGGVKLGVQKNSEQRGLANRQAQPVRQAPQPVNGGNKVVTNGVPDVNAATVTVTTLVTSAETVGVVKTQGFEPVPTDQPVAGPFDGPSSMVVYVNVQGLMTYYHPERRVAYFARAADGKIQYGISALGYYRFATGAKAQALEAAPNALLAWPMAVPVANQIAQYASGMAKSQGGEATLAQQSSLDSPELFAQIKMMSQGVTKGSQTMMDNIGSPDCQKQYQAEYYLGCW